MYAAASAKKAGMPWTAGWIDWSSRVIAALTYSQMPNGIFSSGPMNDNATNTNPSVWPATASACASMHEAILGIGFAALSYQTGVANTALSIAHATALYNNPNPGMIQPYGGQYGPYHWLKVGTNDGYNHTHGGQPSTQSSVDATVSAGYSEPSLYPSSPGDPAHNETYLAVMYKLTGNVTWLNRSILFGSQAATPTIKKTNIQNDHNLSGELFIGRQWTMWLLKQLQIAFP